MNDREEILDELKKNFQGEIAHDDSTLDRYSRDASLFEIRPLAVAFPRDTEEVKQLVRFASERKVPLIPRAGGTDMTGGPLGEGIVLDFTRYFTRIKEVGDLLHNDRGEPQGYAIVEPGVYYRDFEKETLAKGYLLPSYPASREMCAIGGMVANNSGGEKTLKYGKTIDYVMELQVVLADGNEYTVKPLSINELEEKMKLDTFEGRLYRDLFALFKTHREVIANAKPKVSKNSAGYPLWEVEDGRMFNLAKLFVGAQGTLGIITEMKLRLVKTKPYSGMFVIFLDKLDSLTEVVSRALPLEPMSVESFDDRTFKLALKFFYDFFKLFARNPISLFFGFLPEFWLVLRHGMPKLTVLVEFEENRVEEVEAKLSALEAALRPFHFTHRIAHNEKAAKKYWVMRRESFNLLRRHVRGMQTAPFVDDVIVRPERLPEFLPRLYALLDKYGLFYTIAGHMGDGNIHVIPLMRLAEAGEREKIKPAMDEVYDLVLRFGGSITAEHNDGLIRSGYLQKMYGEEMYRLFETVKKLFDPRGIMNPGKKVGSDWEYAFAHVKRG